jgi:nucleoside-diphosphate-sugar epimerase
VSDSLLFRSTHPSSPPSCPTHSYSFPTNRVHGDSHKHVTDRSPLPGPVSPKIVTTWRPDLEQQLISANTREVLEALIIRPGIVFGGPSTVYQSWFGPLFDAKARESKSGARGDDKIEIVGRKDALIPTVHKEDLANAYRLLVEKVCDSYPYLPPSFFSVISHL